MRFSPLILLLTISIPITNGMVEFDVSKVGVDVGETFNLEVTKVEGTFRETTNLGRTYDLIVLNATVTSQNTILVRDSGIGEFPVFMGIFGSWIVFTDWDNWDVYWEIERFRSDANYSVDIFHSRDEFKVVTQRTTLYANPAISEFEQIVETQENVYIKESGIAKKLRIHQNLIRFDGGLSQNEIVISNEKSSKDVKDSFDFLNQFNLIQLIAVSIIGFVVIYPAVKARKKRNADLRINQRWN